MLATAVSKSLHDDPEVSAMQVKVTAREGVVTLTGEVPGDEERSAAELHRDIGDVLNAHNSRSESLRKVLAQSRSMS